MYTEFEWKIDMQCNYSKYLWDAKRDEAGSIRAVISSINRSYIL